MLSNINEEAVTFFSSQVVHNSFSLASCDITILFIIISGALGDRITFQ